jgi:hypothetical protein
MLLESSYSDLASSKEGRFAVTKPHPTQFRARGLPQLNLLTLGPMCITMEIFESALCSCQFFNLRGKTNDQ